MNLLLTGYLYHPGRHSIQTPHPGPQLRSSSCQTSFSASQGLPILVEPMPPSHHELTQAPNEAPPFHASGGRSTFSDSDGRGVLLLGHRIRPDQSY